MKRFTFNTFLSTGFCLLTQRTSCQYVLIQEQRTWDEAQAYCRQNFIDLATVQSNEDLTNLQEAIQPALTSLTWTGLYNDVNSWRWSYKDENVTFDNWISGQPNNKFLHQECVALDPYKWNDHLCSENFQFFCFNGKTFFIILAFSGQKSIMPSLILATISRVSGYLGSPPEGTILVSVSACVLVKDSISHHAMCLVISNWFYLCPISFFPSLVYILPLCSVVSCQSLLNVALKCFLCVCGFLVTLWIIILLYGFYLRCNDESTEFGSICLVA